MSVSVDELDRDSAGDAALDELFTPQGSRALAAWEIASVVSSALIAEWAVLALVGFSKLWLAVPVSLAVALMIASHRARGETLRQLGWRFDNLWEALRVLLPLTAAGALLLALWGWLWFGGRFRVGGWRAGWWGLGLPLWGIAWGLVQQYVLQAFINRRAQEIFGAGWRSILPVALLFALLHLPNPWLCAATFLGGLVWAYTYQRAPNLFALALSHAVMTWLLVSTIPPDALHGLRVGYKYFG
jgi:membrane protease YdiL (CAAX protease family)